MKRHILLVDNLEKLVIKKDSSLLMALTFKMESWPTFLLFENDFYYSNSDTITYKVYPFNGKLRDNSFYIDEFKLQEPQEIELTKEDIIHMRLDPPFDSRYTRILWLLKELDERGYRVVNSPKGLLQHNEKLAAYSHPSSLPTFIGSSFSKALSFMRNLKSDAVIFKPMDLYQGIGVEKVILEGKGALKEINLKEKFEQKVYELKGPIIIQPFFKDIDKGEVRSLYFDGKELGSILKVPLKGEFLANIAQGASFTRIELTSTQKLNCDEISKRLNDEGVKFIAFDILGEHISEVNMTCPGLLVEVSEAYGINFSKMILEGF